MELAIRTANAERGGGGGWGGEEEDMVVDLGFKEKKRGLRREIEEGLRVKLR